MGTGWFASSRNSGPAWTGVQTGSSGADRLLCMGFLDPVTKDPRPAASTQAVVLAWSGAGALRAGICRLLPSVPWVGATAAPAWACGQHPLRVLPSSSVRLGVLISLLFPLD